jgi:hypothetical protein
MQQEEERRREKKKKRNNNNGTSIDNSNSPQYTSNQHGDNKVEKKKQASEHPQVDNTPHTKANQKRN